MKSKSILLISVLILSILLIPFEFGRSDLSHEDYEITKYDPKADVMSIRTGGTALFTNWSNIEITKLTSNYISSPVEPSQDLIELTMTVEGTIQNDDNYRYIFVVTADGEEYIYTAYINDVAVGFELGRNSIYPGVLVEGEDTNTLNIKFLASDIGPPRTEFDFNGIAEYMLGEHERYLDMAPDKLLLVTEPSHGSTINGLISIKGVIRESIEGKPDGNVTISIDDGPFENVMGNETWTFLLDTTTLSWGEHKIYVKIEGEELENSWDEITVYVDQNTSEYEYFDQMPTPNVGDWYYYEAIGWGNVLGLPFNIIDDLSVSVTDFKIVDVNGTLYEAYRIEYHSEEEQDLGYVAFQYEIDRCSLREKDHFGIVRENTITVSQKSFYPDMATNTTTTYTPPLCTYNDFLIAVGFNNKWTFNTQAYSTSSTTTAGEGVTENSPFDRNLEIIGECLYYKENHTVFGYTYKDIYLIKTYVENPGMSIIEYYSPELGVPVQMDMIDPSGDLISSIGIRNWVIPPPCISIENLSFIPSRINAKENVNIVIYIKNQGIVDARRYDLIVEEGESQIAKEMVDIISWDERKKIIVNWKPKSKGNHTINVTLYFEEHELDNKSIVVPVFPPKKKYNVFDSVEFWISIISLVFLLIIIGNIVRKKRKRGIYNG